MPHQRRGGLGHAVAHSKGNVDQAHADLMGGESRGAQVGDDLCKNEKTDAHEYLFHSGRGAYVEQGRHVPLVRQPGFSERKVQETVFGQHGTQGDEEAGHIAKHCGHGRTPHPHMGKPKIAADEQIVEYDVHQVCGQIGAERQLGVAHAPLGSVDGHHQGVEHSAHHQDLEVAGGVIDGIGLGTGKIQKGPGKEEGQGGQKQGSQCDQQQGLPQRAVGAFPVVFAPAAGDHGGDAHIQGHEKGQHDKAGLVRQPYRRDGSRTFYAHHDGVCQADQGDEERFAHGRPGDAEQIAQRFFGVGQRLPHPVFFFDEDLWVKKTVHDFWQSLRNDAPPGIAERRRHEGRPTGRETKISIARSTTLGK